MAKFQKGKLGLPIMQPLFLTETTIKQINFPRDSVKFAEFYGIMLGDGNSHKTSFYNSRKDKRGTYMIRSVGDSRLDREYLIDYVKPIIQGLFNIKVTSFSTLSLS